MGFRFRKSIKLAPGVKLNFNKKSIGMTVGVRGLQHTVNSKGRSTSTVGLPGTGLSYSARSAGGKRRTGNRKIQGSTVTPDAAYIPRPAPRNKKERASKVWIVIWSVLTFVMLVGLSPAWFIPLIFAGIAGYRYNKTKENIEQKEMQNSLYFGPTTADREQELQQSLFAANGTGTIATTAGSDESLAVSQPLSTQLNSWTVSVSFGKSSSQNYNKALFLAKAAPTYHEQTDSGHVLHQAIYSANPGEYLAFISLYELVAAWKSSFVLINGSVIDRKIIGQLNYCYGDKCRSGNPRYCFGASELTDNPFGCHRLQISAANNPWWTFSMPQEGGFFVIDKKAIKDRIDSYAIVYCICPNFDYQRIMAVLSGLPNRITEKEYWRLNDKLCVVAHNRIEIKYRG